VILSVDMVRNTTVMEGGLRVGRGVATDGGFARAR
jgi:hypothetical protein